MIISSKNAPTQSEQAAEIAAWKNKPRTESDLCKARQAEYFRMLEARKRPDNPLYVVVRTGKEYK